MIRSIYTKIFLWFWLAMIATAASMLFITMATGAQPLGRRWMARTLDYYARSAVDIYEHGGRPALDSYLDDLQLNSDMQATLLGSDGHDIAGRGMPEGSRRLVEKAQATGGSEFRAGLRWTGVCPVRRGDNQYLFVAQVRPLRGLFNPEALSALALRSSIALLCVGLLCLLLARHFARPIRSLQTAARKIADGDLSVRAVPAIGQRTDELAELAADFDRMAARVQTLLEKQNVLLGDISHELRSPLARLGVSLELVRRGESSEVDRMEADLGHLERLIAQILTLTRLQSQAPATAEHPVNLKPLVERVAEDAAFEGQKEQKTVHVAEAQDAWLVADPALLRSCVENVTRNAVRYTKPGTEVTLRLTREAAPGAPVARILVSDLGEGVPAEALPHLFEPFYRVSPSRDRNTGGTGLGLSIAQRVVHLYGGSISARNVATGGLELEIRLPLAPDPPA